MTWSVYQGLKWLRLYLCTTSKNGSDVQVCFNAESLVPPEWSENPNTRQCRMWELCATRSVNNEEFLNQNMRSLCAVWCTCLIFLWKMRSRSIMLTHHSELYDLLVVQKSNGSNHTFSVSRRAILLRFKIQNHDSSSPYSR